MSPSNKRPGNTAIRSYSRRTASGLAAISLVFLFSCTEEPGQNQAAAGMSGSYDGMSGIGGSYAGAAGSFIPGSAGQDVAGASGAGGVAGVAGEAGASGVGGVAGVAGVAGEAGASGVGGVAGVAGVGGDGGVGGTSGVGGDGGVGGGLPTDHCMAGITDYTGTGPFSVQSTSSGSVKIWVPGVPAGCKVPVVHLANGTGASCSMYGAILEHLASHGFLAACYENTNTGQGTQCITALETLFSEYPDLADDKIGSTGHSQGGGAAFMCVYHAEEKWGDTKIYAGHAIEPASGYGDSPSNWATLYGQIDSPMFMFNGSSDMLVSSSWVGDAFNALPATTEAYWYEAVGASHMTPLPTDWAIESATPWFRWKLLGDTQACEYFKGLPNASEWSLQDSQSESGC